MTESDKNNNSTNMKLKLLSLC